MSTSFNTFLYCLLLLPIRLTDGCMSGGRTSVRVRPGRNANSEPLIYGEYIPNRSELSVSASGPSKGRITRDSPRFAKLIENQNTDIVFKDEEHTGADRIMTQRCKDKLNSLSIMVMNQWPGVKLRVTESWDEDGSHDLDSLHYEGRAVDISTSDRDRAKLSLLGRLAYNAGFDYVSYESKHHIHCSVKSDEDQSSFATGGCFASNSCITMSDNSRKSIQNLNIGDKVQAISPYTGEIITDKIFMFLDIEPSARQSFIQVRHVDGELTLTDYHLVYATVDKEADFSESVTIYAKDLSIEHFVFVTRNKTFLKTKVSSISHVSSAGYYAPLTFSGNIIVNGVASSCYAAVDKHWLAHLALFPLRIHSRLSDMFTDFGNQSNATIPIPQSGVHWYAQILTQVFPYLLP